MANNQKASQKPNQKPQRPVRQPIAAGKMPMRPGTRKPPNTRRLIYGCAGCSGLALFFFVVLALIFVSQTTAAGENQLAQLLGMDAGTFVNTIITIVNLIFGAVAVFVFLLSIFGIFQFLMARKDDKITRKKGLTMAGVSGILLFFLIFIWVGVFLFMDARRVPITEGVVQGIVTEPANTVGLTAPVTITFDATSVPINTQRYEVLSHLWNFGDGGSSTVPVTSHTYTGLGENQGIYDVRLTITAQDRQSGEQISESFTKVVSISNVAIGAVFTAEPEMGSPPLTVTFDAGESTAPAGNIVSYEWDFTNNKVFTDGEGVTVEHTFEQLGTYTVNLRVTDNTGQFAVSSQEIKVTGEDLPQAVIEIPTEDGNYYVGQQYTFMGEDSSSPAGLIERYEWNFGDGSATATTRTATHIYDDPGTYEVILRVTDEEGTRAEASQTLKVETAASAPKAVIKTVPDPADPDDNFIEGAVPFEVSFDGRDSQDPDDDIVEYNWDFDGDGTTDSAGETVTFAYKDAGVYNATLTVVDVQGNESKSVIVVNAGMQPLQARVTADPVQGEAPLTVTFDAGGSTYPEGQIVSYEWDFGDGSPMRIDVSKVTYKYDQIGTFTANVTAVASDNTRSTAEIAINVRPVALTACFVPTPSQGSAPLTVDFDPGCSRGAVSQRSWDFGDGETTRTRRPTHTYTEPGSYEVTLEVTDNNNVIDTFTQNILVTGSI